MTMKCELCGRDAPYLKEVIIEGSRLMVCPDCAKMGTPATKKEKNEIPKTVMEERLQKRAQRQSQRDILTNLEETLVEDFPDRIRQAREKKRLSREELGHKIQEKASIIGKLENGSLRPDDALRKKLERFLGIQLLTKAESGVIQHHTQKRGMTLGDFIKFEKGKK